MALLVVVGAAEREAVAVAVVEEASLPPSTKTSFWSTKRINKDFDLL
jgi:hypothetical protein